MNKLKNVLLKLQIIKDTKGQDFIEYALITGMVAVAVGAIMPDFATNFSRIYSRVEGVLSTSAQTGS
jgi:pilus assembly protein Flp/PilA